MRIQNLLLQITFPIKLYQPEEDPTVGQTSDKDVQCFLCLVVIILNSEKRDKLNLHFLENINNTQLTTKSIAMT